MPGILHAAKDAFGMGHQNRKAPIRGGKPGNTSGRPIGVQGIDFGGRAAVIDKAQRHQGFGALRRTSGTELSEDVDFPTPESSSR